MSDAKKLLKQECAKILRKRQRKSMKERKLDRLIREELVLILKEAKENGPNMEKKLEDMRKALIREGQISCAEKGSATMSRAGRPEKRIELATVAKVLDVPINELILHFLNGHRIKEGYNNLVEYRLGCVYFYDTPKSEEN